MTGSGRSVNNCYFVTIRQKGRYCQPHELRWVTGVWVLFFWSETFWLDGFKPVTPRTERALYHCVNCPFSTILLLRWHFLLWKPSQEVFGYAYKKFSYGKFPSLLKNQQYFRGTHNILKVLKMTWMNTYKVCVGYFMYFQYS